MMRNTIRAKEDSFAGGSVRRTIVSFCPGSQLSSRYSVLERGRRSGSLDGP
jgi:hypothetical protein